MYNNYLLEKQKFDNLLKSFNCTWKNIRTKETQGKLVINFPKATEISNGQRDILTFISMLFCAHRELSKDICILIIDEIFDYLDDANLTAAQYYIAKFIENFKNHGKELYPIILTHLDPQYFKNYTFYNQRVYYLSKSNIRVSEGMKKLLMNRTNEIVKDDIDKFLLHYNPDMLNKREEFKKLQIPETWGESTHFYDFLKDNLSKYLNNEPYDPFAVCGALRIKIEKTAYDKLDAGDPQDNFISTHRTKEKLNMIECKYGIISPEAHYLLGIIYNEGMHWKDNVDNESAIVTKLGNIVIKHVIKEVLNG
jgi:hypothetical protein